MGKNSKPIFWFSVAVASALSLSAAFGPPAAAQQAAAQPQVLRRAIVNEASQFDVSRPLAELAATAAVQQQARAMHEPMKPKLQQLTSAPLSLGAGTANITRAQHCRAEVYLAGFGWVPVDPADVRKVVLEEKAQPTDLSDPLVQAVRPKLFGAWEMNWLAFNTANDIVLPNANNGKITFFMYPQAETAAGRVDSLDPDNFKYTMTARELAA